MKLVSMKRTAADKKAREKEMNKPLGYGESDDIPYGLRVDLDHEALKKLGMDSGELPSPGDKMKLHSIAHVGEVSEHKRNGKTERRMTLHLHQMGVEPHSEAEHADADKSKGMRAAMEKALKNDHDGDE